MKQELDTDTVLDVINRVELAISYIKRDKEFNENFFAETTKEYAAYLMGQYDALKSISDCYQGYIEGLVSQAENQLGGGE